MTSARRVIATTFGLYAGLLGIEHGFFETLQGNVAPTSLIINAIGPPCQPATAWHGCEPAIWHWLYRSAGVAALAVAAIIPFQIIVFIIWPPPLQGGAGEWFMIFQRNPLVGLINLDLLLVVDNLLGIPITLTLYLLLRGIIFYVAANPAIQMLTLSERYPSAATDAERASELAAGQAMLANWQGTAFHAAYILSSIAWMRCRRDQERGEAIKLMNMRVPG